MEKEQSQTLKIESASQPGLGDVVALLVNMYEVRRPDLLELGRDLANLCRKLANALGWDEEAVKYAMLGGLFHNVGYLAAPTDISGSEQGSVAYDSDMETKHTDFGVRLLQKVKCLKPILPAVRSHHEHYNGTGFPDGLEGKEIPALARLVAVAHAYQVLIRGHKTTPPMSEAEARQVIREDAGIVLDPAMVEVFIENLPPLGDEEYTQTK